MKAATEFAGSLLASARPTPMEQSRVVAAIIEGSASRDAVRSYLRSITALALGFPRRLASVLACCDDERVRASLLSNLLEEEGVVAFATTSGITRDPQRSHAVMARKLARAAGIADGELVQMPPASWFRAAVEREDWLGAFAFFAVGLEANVPETFRLITPPLVNFYGFSNDDVEFLTEHFIADERHGTEAAQLIAEIATTDELRLLALEGARRGGLAWRALHRYAAQ